MIKVFSKENCPRCRLLTNRLQNMGIEHEYHQAEFHRLPHPGWRTNGSVDFLAQLTLQEDELPVVLWGGESMGFELAMEKAMQKKEAEIREQAQVMGWRINEEVLAIVAQNEYNCPCRSRPVACPCPSHNTEVVQGGKCRCGLFERVDE